MRKVVLVRRVGGEYDLLEFGSIGSGKEQFKMTFEAFEWSVVIVGYWNRAILSPSGIAQRLFGLDKGTVVPVEVPLDGIAPFRVRDEKNNLLVTVENERLTIIPSKLNYFTLEKAMQIAVRAIDKLPETPLRAAGFNLNFRSIEPGPEMSRLVAHELCDRVLTELEFQIDTRTVARSLKFADGTISIAISADADSNFKVVTNFERVSAEAKDLVACLKTPIEQIKVKLGGIFEKLGIVMKENGDEQAHVG